MRLALLNACEGARTSRADPFVGVAQHLVQQGIPAVIAMQFEITDQAAIALAHEFYSALADNYGVDAALAEARKALYAAGNDIEWGTPVLYLRAQSGQLFDLAVPAAQSPMMREVTKPEDDKPKQRAVPLWRRLGWRTGLLMLLLLVGVAMQDTRWMGLITPWEGNATPTPRGRVAAVTGSPTTPSVGAVVETPTPAITVTYTPQPPATATATTHPTHMPTLAPSTSPTPAIGATKVITLPSGLAMTFVYVPGGEFLMGSTEAQVDAALALCNQSFGGMCQRDLFIYELQQHTVSVESFWIMQTEVTNAQYRAFIVNKGYENETFWGTNGWEWRQANQDHTQPAYWVDERFKEDEQPVVGVSWYEAMAYARWLATEIKLDLRLPTEAQWEKAARGPKALIFPWGNEWDGTRVNYCDKNCGYEQRDESEDDGYVYTAPVGSYPTGASPYGALDMAGNVIEWTSSLNMVYPYRASDGREDGIATGSRVIRGGSWDAVSSFVRTAMRITMDDRVNSLGFRLVLLMAH